MDEEMKFQTGAKLHPPLLQSFLIVAMHLVAKALSRIFGVIQQYRSRREKFWWILIYPIKFDKFD